MESSSEINFQDDRNSDSEGEDDANPGESANEDALSQYVPTVRSASLFRSGRRLSGLPNMSLSIFAAPLSDLSESQFNELNSILEKFPEPPEKIIVPVSTYSNLASSAGKFVRGLWGSSGKKE